MGGMREKTLSSAVALLHRLRDKTANRVRSSPGYRGGGIAPRPVETTPRHRIFLRHGSDCLVGCREYGPNDPDILLVAGECGDGHLAGDVRDIGAGLVEDLHPGILKGKSQRARQ